MKEIQSTALSRSIKFALSVSAGAGLSTSVVLAQDEDTAELDRIEVTGSRIKRTDIEGASPIFVIQREEIERSGLTSVGDLLQDLPVAGSALNTTFNNGGNGETRLDLRNLGCNRLLVLVNGRRWVTGLAGCVDLNNVPVAVVKRIEVLKDGASSVYGSDAIAGVVNIITRDDFDGAQVNAQYGKYLKESDGENQAFDVSMGATSDRSSVYFNASYVKSEPVFAGDRRISQEPQYGTGNSFGSSGTPQGRLGFSNPATGTFSGSWVTDPGCDVASLGLACFRVGDFSFGAPGAGADRFNFAPDNYLLTPQDRTNIFTQGRYELTDNVSLSMEAAYTNRLSEQLLAPTPLFLGLFGSGPAVNIGVGALNPYNPTGQALPASSWLLGRRMVEAGPRLFQQNVDSYRFAMGFDGSFQAGNRYWDWSLSYVYGKNDRNTVTEGLVDLVRVNNALSDGCVTGAIANCVPLNVFGGANIGTALGGTITQPMLDYILFTAQDAGGNDLRNYTGNITSELFDLPAGPVGFAAGYEWRQTTGFDLPDAIIQTGNTSGTARQPTRGKTKVKEFYVELAVPILSGMTGAERLDLSISSRRSDYDSFGTTTNSKVGLEWQPFSDLLVRGTIAEGFRAPSIIEAFRGQSDSFPTLTDPCNGGAAANPNLPGCAGVPAGYQQPNPQIRITVGSNPNLQPETTDSFTFGFIYSPSWVDGLDLTVDVYEIELSNNITTVGANTILQGCASSLVFCNLLTRGPGGQVLDLLNGGVNAGSAKVKGVDFLLSYTFPETDFGYFKAVWDGAYQDENSIVSQGVDANGNIANVYTNFIGTNQGDFALARWKSTLDFNWSYGDWDATWGIRYTHGQREACSAGNFGAYTLPPGAPNGMPYCNLGPDSVGGTDPTLPGGGPDGVNDFRKLGSTTYHDLQVSYHVSDWDTRLTVGVNNIGDKGPPMSQTAFANSFDSTIYEVPGRFPYIRVTTDF